MNYIFLFLALLPIPLFYLIYLRYFTYKIAYSKHLEYFLAGIFFALLLVFLSPYLKEIFRFSNIYMIAFVNAALLEKICAFIAIVFLQKFFVKFTVIEGTVTAMFFGLGFSAVENIFYSLTFGSSIMMARLLFSVPLHLTTLGIMGYYLSLRKQCRDKIYIYTYYFKALFFSISLHGIFDYTLLSGGKLVYLSAPMLIMMVVFLEVLLAKSQTIMSFDVLKGMKVRFEDWLTVNRQSRFERWIMQSMGLPGVNSDPFFFWRPGFIRFFGVVILIVLAIIGLSFRSEIITILNLNLNNQEQIVLFGVFPASISLIMVLVGAINPGFFKNSELKMPVISDVEIETEYGIEETFITYDISSANCFLRTSEPFGLKKEVKFRFSNKSFSSKELIGVVVWENHVDRLEPFGTIISIKKRDFRFIFGFLVKYNFYRFYKGLIFLLKLPGFEQSRILFMRPITTMQEEKYFKAGDTIYKEGEEGNDFYLLKKGSVVFYKYKESGETITLDSANDGEIFGETAIIGKKKRETSAICATDCIVAVANRENLDALIRNNSFFAQSLIEQLAKKINTFNKILVNNIHSLEIENITNQQFLYSAFILGLVSSGTISDVKKELIDVDMRIFKDLNLQKEDLDEIVKMCSLVLDKKGNMRQIGNIFDHSRILELANSILENYAVNFKK